MSILRVILGKLSKIRLSFAIQESRSKPLLETIVKLALFVDNTTTFSGVLERE